MYIFFLLQIICHVSCPNSVIFLRPLDRRMDRSTHRLVDRSIIHQSNCFHLAYKKQNKAAPLTWYMIVETKRNYMHSFSFHSDA